MTDKLETGQIIEGKVTGIQPYGAFVALNKDTQGLVHISEVTHGYVKDIHDYLAVGDKVKVKILNIDKDGQKISLSIRATEEIPKMQTKTPKRQLDQSSKDGNTGFNSLKEKLEEWIEQSKKREETFK